MAFELSQYPPVNFREKYKCYLAPKGVLLPPHQVFGKNKSLGAAAEEAMKKAFKITLKKLKKMRSACAACGKTKGDVCVACEGCGAVTYCCRDCQVSRLLSHALVCHHLKEELIDQVVECLPSPVTPGPGILKGSGGLVRDWDDWFNTHTSLTTQILQKTPIVRMWWQYTGQTIPEAPVIEASLKRIYSNAFSTPLTVGVCATWFPALTTTTAPTREEFHIHLLGADEPEVRAVQEGIIQVASRVLSRPLVVTLVAPDLVHHPQTITWSPATPYQCTADVKAVAYPGLYHDYWRDHIVAEKEKMKRPDVALAIHPGVHTDAMMALWRPTLMLLAKERVPLAMTTYNEAEFDETMEKLTPLGFNIIRSEKNCLGSLHVKQTPYEPDHVWAANSFLIAIDNRSSAGVCVGGDTTGDL